MPKLPTRPVVRFVGTLGIASLVSIGLFFFGAFRNHSAEYSYLIWNLFLAWIPLGLSMILVRLLRTRHWTTWLPILVSIVWLIFLPNSFYMISDYIHLQEISRDNLLFDVVMFTSFIVDGLLVGFTSLLLVHREYRHKFSSQNSTLFVGLVLLLCSFAIFLGRDLRWNSWDFVVNPAGLLFDVSDRFIHPGAHPEMFLTTISFFVLLAPLYAVVWQAVRLLRDPTDRR